MASVTITWTEATPVASLTTYELVVSLPTGAVVSITNPAPAATGATVGGLAAATTYTLQLRSRTLQGLSSAPASRSFTTPAASPPPPSPPPQGSGASRIPQTIPFTIGT